MKESVWQVLRNGIKKFDAPIDCICIAGNTTMEHLLMGLPVESLGRSPFTPVEIGLQQTEFQGIPVYVTPGISTFVGGDIVAGLYYCVTGAFSQTPAKVDKPRNGSTAQQTNHETVLFLVGN